MSDLPREYFERDLDDLEFARLRALVEEDEAAALLFAAYAEREYAATGLPEPALPRRWRARIVPLAVAACAAFLVLAGLTWMRSARRAGIPGPVQAAGQAELGGSAAAVAGPLSLTFTTKSLGAVTVRVLDQAGRPVRVLYSGLTQAGEHLFQWDGKLPDGRAAGPGRYWLEAELPGGAGRVRKAAVLR